MIIAITTFFQSQTNYGQLLQAFALQQKLMRMGHYPYIIRYGFHEFIPLSLGLEVPEYDLGKLMNGGQKELAKAGSKGNRCFDEFRRVHLNLSRNAYNHLDELRLFPPVADCYITGSDQVWAQLLSKRDNQTFFLDFGPEDVLRISYASSFALESYPTVLNNLLAQNLRRFDAVSVREKTGIDICRNAGTEARWVTDPTMLFDGDFYRLLAKESHTPLPENYMLVYHVNVKKRDMPYWKDFRGYNMTHGIRAVAIHANGEKESDVEFLDKAEYMYPSVQDWIRLIDGCQYMLTTSFHGMIFAILLHKPFLVALRPDGEFAGNDRIVSVLSELGLTDRILSAAMNVQEQLEKPILWEEVDRKTEVLRQDSVRFLSEHLTPRTSLSDDERLRLWTQHCVEKTCEYLISRSEEECSDRMSSTGELKKRIETAWSLSPVRRDLTFIRYGFKYLFKDIFKAK